MFCPKCGTQMPDNCMYCPTCGNAQSYTAPQTEPQPVPVVPVITAKIKKWIGSGYFLAIAILSTVAIIVAMVWNSIAFFLGMPDISGGGLLGLLTCIAMWVAYGNAKSQNGKVSSGLSFSHGVLTAQFILTWIAVVAIAISLVLSIVAIPISNLVLAEVDRNTKKDLESIFEEKSFDEKDVEKEVDKLVDEMFKDEGFINDLESAGIEIERDDVEEFCESYGYDIVEFIVEWTEDHADNFVTSFVNTVLVWTAVGLALVLVYLILVNVLVTRRLKNFADQLNKAYTRNETRELSFGGVKGALIANGIFSLSNPVSAAASFVGAALVGRIEEDLEN